MNSGLSDSSSLGKLVDELVRERRSLRRWGWVKRGIGLMLLAAGVWWAALGHEYAGREAAGPHTAVVAIRGEISADGVANADELMIALRKAFEDNKAAAVVLRINSPGGSPVQAGLINDEIQRLKKLYKKPIYTVVDETCASAAYYIAVATDRIFVNKASVVGSIGVLMDGFGFTELMKKIGVERRLLTAGKNKGLLDPFSPISPEQKAHVQSLLQQIHEQFIAVVRQGRKGRLHETAQTFSGLVWTGQEAVTQGLVDQLGGLDFVVREIVKTPDWVDYTPHDNVVDRISKQLGKAMGQVVVNRLENGISWH
jgi:protease-4